MNDRAAASPASERPACTPWQVLSTPLRSWLHLLGALGGVVLGAVFLVAAWAKTLDPPAFAAQIEQEGLAFLVPAPVLAFAVLALEVFLGGALVLGVRRRFVLWPTAALVLFFLFLTGRAYWRDLHGLLPADAAGCGCFGNLVERTPAEAFWQDVLLLVPALALALLAPPRELAPAWRSAEGFPRRRLAAVGTLVAATLLVAWKAPELPLDDVATRLRPGVDPLTLCAGRDEAVVCLDSVLPEIALGEHVVVIAELTEAGLGRDTPWLNDYHLAGAGPALWVLTAASNEELFEFRFGHGPVFEIREAPAALLTPLYRTLPRSFLMRDGAVVETWSGLPPLERWGAPPRPAPEPQPSNTP